jgi:hypothetical protein
MLIGSNKEVPFILRHSKIKQPGKWQQRVLSIMLSLAALDKILEWLYRGMGIIE